MKRYRFRNTDFMQQRVMVGRYESTCALWFSHANYIADTNCHFYLFQILRRKEARNLLELRYRLRCVKSIVFYLMKMVSRFFTLHIMTFLILMGKQIV